MQVVTPSSRFLDGNPRSVWLSLAGGVSVAYVFAHLLPELAAGRVAVSRTAFGTLGLAERHVYLIALTGLAVFCGLDRLAKVSRSRREGAPVSAGRGLEARGRLPQPRRVLDPPGLVRGHTMRWSATSCSTAR